MTTKSKTRYVSLPMILGVVVIYFIHMITVRNLGISFVVGFIEFVGALALLCSKTPYLYIYLILILGGTFDVPAFITGEVSSVIYNFTIFPVVAGYHLYTLIILLYIINRYEIYRDHMFDYALVNMKRIVKTVDVMVFAGIFFGIVTLITDDNGILNIFWLRYLVGDIVSICVIPMLGVCLIYNILKYGDSFALLLQRTLIAIMISIPIVTLFSLVLGQHGRYGSEEILLAPLTLFFTPLIILFVFYKKYHMRVWAVAIFSLCMFFQLFFSNALSGKSWLAIIFILVMCLVSLYKNGHRKFMYALIIVMVAFSSIAISLIEKKIENSTGVSTAKLAQAVQLLSLSNDNWYDNIPFSPKVRLEEFLNISQEYVKKPWFALLGKGWCGNTKDHRNGFGYNDEASFSLDQYQNNSYVNMHETINVVFLKYGIIGLIFLFIFIRRLLATLSYSPWGACAILWLLLFLGYSFSLGSFGLTAMILAFYEYDRNYIYVRDTNHI